MTDDDFYGRVAEILGTTHEGSAFPHDYRTRWNDRGAGRGRYPGFGTIRVFGDTVHISLKHPIKIGRTVEGREEAIRVIRERLAQN